MGFALEQILFSSALLLYAKDSLPGYPSKKPIPLQTQKERQKLPHQQVLGIVAVGDGDRGGGLGGTVAVGRESVEVRLNEMQWKCKK